MLQDFDRSGYFGGSDCKHVMARNRNTKTWNDWWDIKTGKLQADQIGTIYTRAGNLYEHHILKAIDEDMTLDGQIIYEKYRLRINYDGYKDGIIYECKTHKASKEFQITKEYWMQCQVEMFVYRELCREWFLPDFKGLILVSYPLYDNEYVDSEDEIEINEGRISLHEIEYDKAWIKGEYLPHVKELARALSKGKRPTGSKRNKATQAGKVIGAE